MVNSSGMGKAMEATMRIWTMANTAMDNAGRVCPSQYCFGHGYAAIRPILYASGNLDTDLGVAVAPLFVKDEDLNHPDCKPHYTLQQFERGYQSVRASVLKLQGPARRGNILSDDEVHQRLQAMCVAREKELLKGRRRRVKRRGRNKGQPKEPNERMKVKRNLFPVFLNILLLYQLRWKRAEREQCRYVKKACRSIAFPPRRRDPLGVLGILHLWGVIGDEETRNEACVLTEVP
jgi:hypothetical protein